MHLIPDNIELSKDRVPKNVPYKHITYADHHDLVREYRALAAELKELSGKSVDKKQVPNGAIVL